MSDPLPAPSDIPGPPAVVVPQSVDEAVAAFRSGEPPTVVGGGTIVVPDAHAGRHRPGRTLVLSRAGLDTRTSSNGVATIGAGVTLDRLVGTVEPLGTVAGRVADREIRGQATIGGNLCAGPHPAVPRGDLQVPLVALDARVRLVTADAERTMPVADFLAGHHHGLVLSVEIDEMPRLAGTARLERAHTHSYTGLHVCAVATPREGRLSAVRVVAGGVNHVPMRLSAVEAALDGVPIEDVDPTVAGVTVTGIRFREDGLASAWYRQRVLPVLVRRACQDMLGREEQHR